MIPRSRAHQTRTTLAIFSGFLVITLLITILGAVGSYRVYESNETLRETAQVRGNKVALMGDMMSAGHMRSQMVLQLFTDIDPEQRRQTHLRYADWTVDFEIARDGFRALGMSAEESRLLEYVNSAATRFSEIDEYIGFISTPMHPDHEWLTTTLVLDIYDELETALRRLLEFERTSAFREVSDVSKKNQQAYESVLWKFGLALVMGCLVSLWVTRLVSKTESALYSEKERARATLNGIAEGVVAVDAAERVEYMNPAAERLTGWDLGSARGKHLKEVYKLSSTATQTARRFPARLRHGESENLLGGSHVLIARDRNEHEVEESVAPIYGASGSSAGAVIVFRDVTVTRDMSRKLAWQASHDELTGLVNRREFELRLQEAVGTARREGKLHALLFVDLDQFKVINDTCGHIAGDQMLCQVGTAIRQQIRDSDVLARLGGDEYGILLQSCRLDHAYEIAQSVLELLRGYRFPWRDKFFTVGASIGMVVIDNQARDTTQLMSAADLACYAAKEGGRDCIRLYETGDPMLEHVADMGMAARISHAIDQGQFRLYLQRVAGLQAHNRDELRYEVLLRMQGSDGEVLTPDAFLGTAQRYSLMKAIDRMVVRMTFEYLHHSEMACATDRNAMYAINLSGASINDDTFIDYVKEQLAAYRIPPRAIGFEVTETIAIANLAQAAELMHEVRALGCEFALDDFGTGMSSFAYLKHLPVDYLKIDGTFVKDVVRDRIDQEIIGAIVRICRTLGIDTIGEFVEDQAIADKLTALGVSYGQGYAIGHPLEWGQAAQCGGQVGLVAPCAGAASTDKASRKTHRRFGQAAQCLLEYDQ